MTEGAFGGSSTSVSSTGVPTDGSHATLSIERRMKIVKTVNMHKTATVAEIAQWLGASPATVRRDLAWLDEQGLIMRTRGGATAIDYPAQALVRRTVPSYEQRLKEYRKEKQSIKQWKDIYHMKEQSGRRFHRLFGPDGKSVVIAMDHGITEGVMRGFEDPGKLLEQVVAGGADVILTSEGIARHFSKQLSGVGLMIRCDGATSPLLERPRELIVDIETILSLGADAVAAMYFPGIANGHGSTIYFPRLAAQAQRWNVPIMAEALPYGFEAHKDSHAAEAVAAACRMAAENGADIVKTFYTGTRESFKRVVSTCFVPVLALGGPRVERDEDFLEVIRGAMDAGAAGVVIGRNVWQAAHPTAMTRALAAIVHHDASVAEALSILHDATR